ncbi:MAG: DUF4159 domain-containing protein [Planctomycetaceae bacterium]
MVASIGYWTIRAWRTSRHPDRSNRQLSFQLSVLYVMIWPLLVWGADAAELREASAQFAQWGTGGIFTIGLAWFVWWLEIAGQRFELQRKTREEDKGSPTSDPERDKDTSAQRVWHPLDLRAWYYGSRSPRLNQSLTGLMGYSLAFMLILMSFSQISGCQELYEMPAGGGVQQTLAQTVRVQKVIKKKFVVNPFSAILFRVPPIDEIKLQLTEITKHAYSVGYGEGEGAGFAGGKKQGKVRFIRLEYVGGDWDQDFGVGSDLNMLAEYNVRTSHPVAGQTESRTIEQMRNFPLGASPPMVFMTGQGNVSISNAQVKILREYLTDKHGMLFIDNGGSPHFHNQILGMMRNVLPAVRPTPIPLDDVIHRIPYQIPFLPLVAPHGGKEALGWRVDGRLVCYYHPGDIADAWSDDHSGVPPEIWEACYQLGTNVIFYAHTEYSKWLSSRGKSKE